MFPGALHRGRGTGGRRPRRRLGVVAAGAPFHAGGAPARRRRSVPVRHARNPASVRPGAPRRGRRRPAGEVGGGRPGHSRRPRTWPQDSTPAATEAAAARRLDAEADNLHAVLEWALRPRRRPGLATGSCPQPLVAPAGPLAGGPFAAPAGRGAWQAIIRRRWSRRAENWIARFSRRIPDYPSAIAPLHHAFKLMSPLGPSPVLVDTLWQLSSIPQISGRSRRSRGHSPPGARHGPLDRVSDRRGLRLLRPGGDRPGRGRPRQRAWCGRRAANDIDETTTDRRRQALGCRPSWRSPWKPAAIWPNPERSAPRASTPAVKPAISTS